ncbi:MAG: dethiobiotin synthase [Chitinophagales bacterium]|nr:dethiobiotin synthase [Chitinophagales bacterium]
MKVKFPNHFFVTGIGTGVGKTLTSAVLTEALQCDYWKPIQSGSMEVTDRQIVQSLVTNSNSKFHRESYLLKDPSSPHYAALLEHIEIDIERISMPQTTNRLLVEGAGGLLVPINGELVVFDLIEYFNLPVVVVARNYLGSINHTLLTLQFLESQGANILGVIFSGDNYNDNEEIIEHLSGIHILGRLAEAKIVNKEFVKAQALEMIKSLSLKFDL